MRTGQPGGTGRHEGCPAWPSTALSAAERRAGGRAASRWPRDTGVRSGRYAYRGQLLGQDDYESWTLSRTYLARGGAVLRLVMICAPSTTGSAREEFILRRVRAGLAQDSGGHAAVSRSGPAATSATWPAPCWPPRAARAPHRPGRFEIGIVIEAGVGWAAPPGKPRPAPGMLVRPLGRGRSWPPPVMMPSWSPFPPTCCAPDMWPTANHPQHLLADSGKARRLLGWQPAPAQEGLARSVGWHLASPAGRRQHGLRRRRPGARGRRRSGVTRPPRPSEAGRTGIGRRSGTWSRGR